MTRENSLAGALFAPPVDRIAAPLREQVIETLRRAILDFRLQPGQRLVERELVEQLGVSRTTVREALRELTSEGLVAVVPQKGAVVATPTLDEAVDLYAAREVLEALLVRRFAERASEQHIAALKTAAIHFGQVVSLTTEIRDILGAKDGFYAVLIEGAQSPALQQILGGIQARVQVLRATSLSEQGRARVAVDELNEIAAALENRDAELGAQLTEAHIRRAANSALAHMQSTEQPSASA